MRTKSLALLAVMGLVIAQLVLSGHHAFNSEFDAKKPIKLRGTVTKMEWINPHAWIHVDVKKADGSVEKWMIEAGTPNTLFRRGFTKNSLLPGTEVLIDGYQSRRWFVEGQRKRSHAAQRSDALSGLLWHGRPVRGQVEKVDRSDRSSRSDSGPGFGSFEEVM